MHQFPELPPPEYTLVLGDGQQDERVFLYLIKCQRSWWGQGWGGQLKYVGFGVTAVAAKLMANLGSLFIRYKINPTNVAKDSLNTSFLCKG